MLQPLTSCDGGGDGGGNGGDDDNDSDDRDGDGENDDNDCGAGTKNIKTSFFPAPLNTRRQPRSTQRS